MIQEKKDSFQPQEQRGTNRRGPGGRREDEKFVSWFMFLVFLKKKLRGLCVLCGSYFSICAILRIT
jgi:hypothetical protein